MKICIIDDDPLFINVLEAMLNQLGYKDIRSVCDPILALRMLNDTMEEYDCILLDINMPGMTGIDLCRLLRADPKYSFVPIVMLTALLDKDSVNKAFRAGSTDYLNKPVDMVELEMRLRNATNINKKRRCEALTEIEYPLLNLRSITTIESIRIDGVKNVIDYSALCNYLTHMSVTGLDALQVVACVLHDFEAVKRKASDQELNFMLSEVASVIADAFDRYDCLISYFRNGGFVVVTDKSELEPSIEMEGHITSLLVALQLEYDDGSAVLPDLSIGKPIRPNTSRTRRVTKTFERAMGRAEDRRNRKKTHRFVQAEAHN